VQVFSNKYIRIKQPMEDTDIIRIAIDLRFANQFETFWFEQSGVPVSSQEQVPDTRVFVRGDNRMRDIYRRDQRNPRENINLLLNANNEIMFFNSPCKFHFAFNNSEFHEGIDLNLLNLKESPINLCVCLPEHKGVEVLMSRAVYFCDWELIPKEPFLLTQ